MSLADSLDALVSLGGSDLLMSCGSPPRVRKDGTIVTVPGAAPVDAELIGPMLRSLLGEQRWETLQKDRSVDFSFTWQSHVRMRGNAFFQRGTLAAAFRLLPLEIPGFEQLGVPGIVPALLERSQGLMLVTGPTGSGKSTTQAAMIEHLNRSRGCHIITVEEGWQRGLKQGAFAYLRKPASKQALGWKELAGPARAPPGRRLRPTLLR